MCTWVITNHFTYNLYRAGKRNRKDYVGGNGGGFFGSFVPAAPCCVFYATWNQIYWRLDMNDMVFASTQIWCQTQGTQGRIDWFTYKYILTPPVTCTHRLSVLQWMNNLLIEKRTLHRSTISLLFKKCSLVEIIYVLIRQKETMSFLWNTKILIEMV